MFVIYPYKDIELIVDIRLPVRQSDDEDEGGGMGRNEKFYRGIKASSSSLLCGGQLLVSSLCDFA